MLLGDILRAGAVQTNFRAADKYEAIEKLVNLLAEARGFPPELRAHLLAVVNEREKVMSTGMQHGIALPHGASDRISEPVGALGVASDGVPFDTLDGLPAKLIILIVMPQPSFRGRVMTLVGIAHLFRNEILRDSLVQAASAAEVLNLIAQAESNRELA